MKQHAMGPAHAAGLVLLISGLTNCGSVPHNGPPAVVVHESKSWLTLAYVLAGVNGPGAKTALEIEAIEKIRRL